MCRSALVYSGLHRGDGLVFCEYREWFDLETAIQHGQRFRYVLQGEEWAVFQDGVKLWSKR